MSRHLGGTGVWKIAFVEKWKSSIFDIFKSKAKTKTNKLYEYLDMTIAFIGVLENNLPWNQMIDYLKGPVV